MRLTAINAKRVEEGQDRQVRLAGRECFIVNADGKEVVAIDPNALA